MILSWILLSSKSETIRHIVLVNPRASSVNFLVYLFVFRLSRANYYYCNYCYYLDTVSLGTLASSKASPNMQGPEPSSPDVRRCGPSLCHLHSFLCTMCFELGLSVFSKEASLWGCLVCQSLLENLFLLHSGLQVLLKATRVVLVRSKSTKTTQADY